MMFGGKHLREP